MTNRVVKNGKMVVNPMEDMKEMKKLLKGFLENEVKVKMDYIRRNYMKESKIRRR